MQERWPWPATAAADELGPIFVDGQAQIVPEFSDPATWIRQQLWVETEFDSDGDGELDRVHVDVTRDHILDGEPWSNHGLFTDLVTEVSGELLAAGVIDHTERAALIRAAAMSRVGR